MEIQSRSINYQEKLDLSIPLDALSTRSFSGPCALEDDGFPFEDISAVATLESWRKEINRPIYHIHKWWAQRLGTIFRAMTIGALTPSGVEVMDNFYRPLRLKNAIVFDPFMGSGTTVGEAAKMGARVIGRDINPVAYFLVRNALSHRDRHSILTEFAAIERDVSADLRSFYETRLPDGQHAEVLYYFWVKVVPCPYCQQTVDLRSTRIFARHADTERHPEVRAVCPECGDICVLRHDDKQTQCGSCGARFNPHSGPAKGQKATCPACDHEFPIARTIRRTEQAPRHRLYAKLVLLDDGSKLYAPATHEDRASYDAASRQLMERTDPYPVVEIKPGYNTNQALGYNYRYWHQMFNDRQLLCLSILADRIRVIDDPALRDLFSCLFSGVLEFNNIFASYKGEGTGAVRHMFAHHILKPERAPIEANLWGTSKSSGSFMTLFEGRICRALDYAEDPFEIRPRDQANGKGSEKVFGLSEKLGFDLAEDYADFAAGKQVYLSCGDSSNTDLPDRSVDAVITDPPFFDNVHYSQLADFFYVWQRHLLGQGDGPTSPTTRSPSEVQSSDVAQFTDRLTAVWSEASRVLKDDGVLTFTYHHSRCDGWRAILQSLLTAGFGITAAQPVKAEMSVAMPKRQAKDPIDLDVILVCRKCSRIPRRIWHDASWDGLTHRATRQVRRLRQSGRSLGLNDIRVVVMAQLLRELSRTQCVDTALAFLDENRLKVETAITTLHGDGTEAIRT